MKIRLELTTKCEKETFKIGRIIGENISFESVICLDGDLAAGKTVLSKGICKGMGITEHITSPTFSIINEYDIQNGKVYHMDMYRIKNVQELEHTGFDDCFDEDTVVIIEWANYIRDSLDDECLWIEIEKVEFTDERVLKFLSKSDKYDNILNILKEKMDEGTGC